MPLDASEEMQMHLLEFFEVKNDFATTIEMYQSLRENGIPTGGPEFENLRIQEWLDERRNNNLFEFKINSSGVARLRRLRDKYRDSAPTATSLSIGQNYGAVIQGSQLRDFEFTPAENPNTHPTSPATKPHKNIITKSWKFLSENPLISSIIGGTIALVVGTILLIKFGYIH